LAEVFVGYFFLLIFSWAFKIQPLNQHSEIEPHDNKKIHEWFIMDSINPKPIGFMEVSLAE
jgi:hypothetical protein